MRRASTSAPSWAQPASSGTYTFHVQQTYSDGSTVNWNGPDSSDTPAPRIRAASSLGAGSGGGTSVLTIIALVIGVLALAASVLALVSGGGRSGGGGRALA